MKRTVVALVLTLAGTLVLAACGGGSSSPLSAPSGSAGAPAPADTIVVGSANFTESQLLGSIYAQALAAKGVRVTEKPNLGSRERYLGAFKDGSVDLVPEYSGTLLQFLDKNASATSPAEVYAALQKALPPGLSVLDRSAAEDKDAIVVSQATAKQYHLTSIADLAPECQEMVFGGPSEIAQRPDGLPGFQKNYNCVFKEFRPLDAGGPLTVKALQDGTVQAADIFTTDASIPEHNFVVLADPKSNFAAQNVLPLINTKKATDTVKNVLNTVSGKLDTTVLLDLNKQLAAPDKPNVATVAKQWLTSVGLI